MNDNIKKADFICDCVKAVLSDGEPHRYREILNYTRQQAKGTRFDGEIEQNNMVQYINALIGKSDSRYERVRHGIYQMKTSQRIAESALDNQFDKLYSMLDCACDLKEQMKKAYTECCNTFPEMRADLSGEFKYTLDSLNESINGLSAWIAKMDDLELEGNDETEDESETLRVQM